MKYPLIWNFKEKRQQGYHRYLAESILGRRLPRSVFVHHVDGDIYNNKEENLVVCPSQSYHRLLHYRTEALQATGNANSKKCSYCKGWDTLEQLTTSKKPGRDAPQYWHSTCRSEHRRRLYATS